MANTTCFRQLGQTVALSVGAASHAAVTVNTTSNDQANFASFLNIGANSVAVTVAPALAPATVFPVDGTPSSVIVLPALMTMPAVYAVPPAPFSVTAIGSAIGPALVYITPVGDQS